MDSVTIPALQTTLRPGCCSHKYQITGDITGIFIDFPDEVSKVNIWIGGQTVATFDAEMKSELEKLKLFLTLSYYFTAYIEIVYKDDYLEQQQEYADVAEYVEEVSYGEEAEIYDGNGYHTGDLVIRKQVRTGRLVRKATKSAVVTIPEITMQLQHNNSPDRREEVSFRQKIFLSGITTEEKTSLLTHRKLEIVTEDIGYITNILYFESGYFGLKYSF